MITEIFENPAILADVIMVVLFSAVGIVAAFFLMREGVINEFHEKREIEWTFIGAGVLAVIAMIVLMIIAFSGIAQLMRG